MHTRYFYRKTLKKGWIVFQHYQPEKNPVSAGFNHIPPLEGDKPKPKVMYFFTNSGDRHSTAMSPHNRQWIRVMKLTTFLLVAVCLHVSAIGFGQKVNISGKDLPLEKVFSMIKKQTGYVFFYDYTIFQGTKTVTVDLKSAEIEDAMKVCLDGQDLAFNITNKTISVIRKEEKKIKMEGPALEKAIKIFGVVHNEGGQTLSGANVTVKETGKSTITNAMGEFTLSAVYVNTTLIVTYIGYSAKSVIVKGDGESINVRLSLAMNDLDRAVVQAYGTTSQRFTTSSIGKVTAAEIEKQPIMNPLLALQGKVAGLDIIQTNGFASAPIKVELRGRGAINSQFTSDPLYIIDGVPLTVLEVGSSSSYQTGSTGFIQNQNGFNGPAGGQSPLFSVNSADIESIEVLKDADATAIYGSRGANGVILITTKKGKASKTHFDLHVQEGISKVTRFYQLLNTSQYLTVRREAFKNDGIVPDPGNAYDLLSWDTSRYVDWQRALYGKSAKTIDAQGSVSGGDAQTTFRIAIGYNHSANILTVSGADQRASASFNVSHRSMDQRFNISFTGGYSFTQSDMISIPGNFLMPPNAPVIYDSIGNLNFAGWGGKDQNSTARSAYPYSGLKQPYTSRTGLLNGVLALSYQPMKGLLLSTTLGYNNAQANQQNYVLIASQDPLNNPTGSSNLGYNSNKNWIIEPQLSYSVVIGKGRLNALLGGSTQQTNTDGIYVNGNGFTSDALIRTISNAPSQYTTDSYGEYRYAALFGNLNYIWNSKYIIHLSGRRDGSSRFGAGKQFGNFAAVGAAWIFSEEEWFKNRIPFMSFGKFRGSYGTTGSDGVGDYQYLTRWTSNGTRPYDGTSSLQPIQHANPDFRWQIDRKIEGSIDLGFIKDRIHISATFYRTRIGNQLVSFPIPALTGFAKVTANSPALVENKGWEFIVDTKIIHTKSFDWSVRFNTAFNKNKLVAYPNFELSPYVGQLIVGQSLNIIRLLHSTGVDPQTGHYTFQDKNHNGKTDYDYNGKNPDDTYNYDLSPRFFGGVGVDFSYKGLSLSLYFNFKKQIGVNNVLQGDHPGTISNQPVGVLTRWQKPGDISSVAAFTTQPSDSYNYYKFNSDGSYTDASYIRLNNLSINYQLPASYVKKIDMQGCKLFLHAQNLFVITKYKGIDPETQNFGSLPPAKTIVGGINFDF